MEREQEPTTVLCTNCKRQIQTTTFQLHEVHCRRNLVLCEKCEEPVRRDELEQHLKEEHGPVPCDLCDLQVPKDELDAHKEDQCPKYELECKFCELQVLRKDYQEHVESCGSRTDFCELCNQRVMLKEMEEHRELKCAHVKADDALDPAILQQLQEDDLYHHHHHSPYHKLGAMPTTAPIQQWIVTTPISHTHSHAYMAVAADSAVPFHSRPSPPPPTVDKSKELHVDPQWLESVAGACGEDDLDQVLAQNIMIEDYQQETAFPRPSKSPLRVVQVHAYGPTSATMEENDAEMARRLYERDWAYSQRNKSRMPPVVTELGESDTERDIGSETGGDFGGVARDQEPSVSRDAEKARQLHERDVSYARRVERDREMAERQRDVGVAEPSVSNDAEIARQLFERERSYVERVERDREMAEQMQKEEEHRHGHTYLTPGQGFNGYGDSEDFTEQATVYGEDRHRAERRRPLEQSTSALEQAQLAHKSRIEEFSRGGGYSHWEEESHVELHPPYTEDDAQLALKLQFEEEDRHGFGAAVLHKTTPHMNPHQDYDDDDARLAYRWQPKEDRHYSTRGGYGAAEQLHDKAPPYRGVETDPQQEEEIPCQFCNKLFQLDRISAHQVVCKYLAEDDPERDYSHTSPPYQPVSTSDSGSTMSTTSVASGYEGMSPSEDKGPCEHCGELITVKDLIRHESICQTRIRNLSNSRTVGLSAPQTIASRFSTFGAEKSAGLQDDDGNSTLVTSQRNRLQLPTSKLLAPELSSSSLPQQQSLLTRQPLRQQETSRSTEKRKAKLAIQFPGQNPSALPEKHVSPHFNTSQEQKLPKVSESRLKKEVIRGNSVAYHRSQTSSGDGPAVYQRQSSKEGRKTTTTTSSIAGTGRNSGATWKDPSSSSSSQFSPDLGSLRIGGTAVRPSKRPYMSDRGHKQH